MPAFSAVAFYGRGIYGVNVYGPPDIQGSAGVRLIPPSPRVLMPPR